MNHYHWLVGAILLTAVSWGGNRAIAAEDTFSAAYHLAKVDYYESAMALADQYIALYEQMKADYQALYGNTGKTPGARVPKGLVQRFDAVIAYAKKMRAFYEGEAAWHMNVAEQIGGTVVENWHSKYAYHARKRNVVVSTHEVKPPIPPVRKLIIRPHSSGR